MSASSGSRHSRGFTLIELLVALTIFAVMAVSMFIAFNNVQTSKEVTDRASDRLKAYQIAFNIIGQDMMQMTPRPIRNEYGDLQYALRYSSDDGHLVFTRTGWTRSHFFTKYPRSDEQRVDYYLEDGKLMRAYWHNLDRAPGTKPVRTMLLKGISDFSVKFLYDDRITNPAQPTYNKLIDHWPPDNMIPPVGTSTAAAVPPKVYFALPKAIDLTFDTDDLGKIHRSYLVPNGADEVF